MKKFSDLWISTNKYKQPNTNEKTATIKYNVRYIKYAQMKDQLNDLQNYRHNETSKKKNPRHLLSEDIPQEETDWNEEHEIRYRIERYRH